MSAMQGEISPRTAVFSIVTLLVVTVGGIVGVTRYLAGPAVRPERDTRAARPAAVAEEPVADYTGSDIGVIAARNLFKVEEHAKASPVVTAPLPLPTPPPKPPPQVRPYTPPPARPAGPKLVFTGVVELPAGTFALIENLDTSRSLYARVGGMAFDYQVVAVSAKSVTLQKMDQMLTLVAGEGKPEEKPAAPATPATPAQPAAQPANQPPAATAVVTPPTGAPSSGFTGNPGGYRGRGRMRTADGT
jgi:hypothetical protein